MICCRCHRRFVDMVSRYNSVTYGCVMRVICDDCFGELDNWMLGDWAPLPTSEGGV